jgi:hypothetical protein
VLAFRERTLVGVLELDVRDDRIVDIHAIVDPAKLALVNLHLSPATAVP